MNPFYLHLSEEMTSYVETEQGPLPIRGIHALAGMQLTPISLGDDLHTDKQWSRWAHRMAWFWNAVAMGLTFHTESWLMGLEWRSAQDGHGKLQTGLWVKALAPNAESAGRTAQELAHMAATLLPGVWQPQPLESQKAFLERWGVEPPAWLGEVRQAMFATAKPDGDRSQPSGWDFQVHPWGLYSASMTEAGALLQRLPEKGELSIGICPTQIFETEHQTLKGLRGGLQVARQDRAFFVRVRVGGESETVRWLAQGVASAGQKDSSPEHIDAETFSERSSNAPVIVIPTTVEEQETAMFNWQWADFQPWGELSVPIALRRFRYLHTAAQVGKLAGVWG